MGWCHEFGPQIFPACDHPMVAGPDACSCPQCETVCKGRFAGCVAVWARGPRSVTVRVRPSEEPARRARSASTTEAHLATDVVPALDPAELHEVNGALPPSSARPGAPVVDGDAFDRTVAVVDQLAAKLHQLETSVATATDTATKATAAAAAAARPAPVDERMPAVVNQLAGKVRELEASVAKATDTATKAAAAADTAAAAAAAAAKAPRVAPAPAAPPDNARIEMVTKAMGTLAAGLDRLAAEVSGLRTMPDRLDELERRSRETAPPHAPEKVERLAGDLARLSTQVGELTASVGRTERMELGATVTRLAARVEDLGQAQAQLEAARRSQPVPPPDLTAVVQRLEQRLEQVSARMTPLTSLAGQLNALESAAASADAQTAGHVERLATRVEDLASTVEALRSRPPEQPVQPGRIPAIERVVGGLVRSTERLSARIGDLDEVPKRLEALEMVEQPPVEVEKALVSMGKRLDRLSTQVGDLKSLPHRVRAIEDDGGRSESLTRGLGGAIDMIDQLSAQVAAIQDAGRAGSG